MALTRLRLRIMIISKRLLHWINKRPDDVLAPNGANSSPWLQPPSFNSLAPGRSECDSQNLIFNLVLLTGTFRSSHDNALRWMPQDLTDDQSTLVQVMAWCSQATSHCLNQCWPRSLPPYGVTRPQWVNPLSPGVHMPRIIFVIIGSGMGSFLVSHQAIT